MQLSAADDKSKSGLLDRVDGSMALIVDEDGSESRVPIDDLTLPCPREVLMSYLARTEGPEAVGTAFVELADDPLDCAHNSSCREVFTEALVCEHECWISTRSLAILAEEERGEPATLPRRWRDNVPQSP